MTGGPWREWARRCLAKMRSMDPQLEHADGAAQALAEIERTGLEPYWSLKAFAVLELGMDDRP